MAPENGPIRCSLRPVFRSYNLGSGRGASESTFSEERDTKLLGDARAGVN